MSSRQKRIKYDQEQAVLIVARAMYDASNARPCGPDSMWFPNPYDIRMARVAIAAYQAFTNDPEAPRV